MAGVVGAGDDVSGCVDVTPVGTVFDVFLPDVLPVVLMPDDDAPEAGTMGYNTWCADGETILVETDMSVCWLAIVVEYG